MNEDMKRKKVREILTKLRMSDQPEAEQADDGDMNDMFPDASEMGMMPAEEGMEEGMPEEAPADMQQEVASEDEVPEDKMMEDGSIEGEMAEDGSEEEDDKASLQKQLAAYFSGMKKNSTR